MWIVRPGFRGLAAAFVPAACLLAIVVAPACAGSLGEGSGENSQEEPAAPAAAQEGAQDAVEQLDVVAEAARLGELWRQEPQPGEELLDAAAELRRELRRRAGLPEEEPEAQRPPATRTTAAPGGPVTPSAAPTPPDEIAARERATEKWMTVSPPEEPAPGDGPAEGPAQGPEAWRQAAALLEDVEAAWRAEPPDREAIEAKLAELEALLGALAESGDGNPTGSP